MSETGPNEYRKIDVVKDVLIAIVMIAVFYVYWLAILLLLSVFLVNVWHISFSNILLLSGGLTAVTAIVYIILHIKRRRKQIRLMKYLRE